MLETVRSHAAAVGAKRIVASIVSRECLDAMASVFGMENITVEEEGTYHPVEEFGESSRGDTRALLIYPIN